MAAAAGVDLPGLVSQGKAASTADTAPVWRWAGTALGARAELAVAHPDAGEARRLVALALGEVERLEAVFSLYRSDSAVSRLNASGHVEHPPQELVALLARARTWSRRTQGAFDVTVQPLWSLYRRHFAQPGADPDGPPRPAVEAAAALVDYRALELAPDRVRLKWPGMAVTLNGIAQGYVTDRVAELLRSQGLERVLVTLGETRAVGPSATGSPWRVGRRMPGGLSDAVELIDAALATSSSAGLRFDPAGRFHHLFDPLSGGCARGGRTASVVAERACDADALSTAVAVAGRLGVLEAALRDLGVRRILIDEGDAAISRPL